MDNLDEIRRFAEHYQAAFAANADSHAGFTEVAAIWAEAMTPADLLALVQRVKAAEAELGGALVREQAMREIADDRGRQLQEVIPREVGRLRVELKRAEAERDRLRAEIAMLNEIADAAEDFITGGEMVEDELRWRKAAFGLYAWRKEQQGGGDDER